MIFNVLFLCGKCVGKGVESKEDFEFNLTLNLM